MALQNISTDPVPEVRTPWGEPIQIRDAPEKPSLDLFSSAEPEYIVYAESEASIPPEFFEQLDALHRHYIRNREFLETAYQRREALHAAEQRWKKTHSPVERDTIVNYQPIRLKASRTSSRTEAGPIESSR